MRPSPGISNTESEAPVILFLPGNKGTLSRFLPQFRELCNAGFAVHAFGYRGFGGSENTPPSERGVRLDVDGAWRHLVETRRVDPRRIIVFAQSLGCAFGTRLAARCNPSGLICEAGFRSLAAITARRVPWIPVALLTPKSYETGRHLEKVRCPVLVAHSVEDPAVPFEEALSLFRAARAPKTLVRLRGAHARGLEVMPSEFLERIKTFFLSRPPGP
jgi:hypothetical protein